MSPLSPTHHTPARREQVTVTAGAHTFALRPGAPKVMGIVNTNPGSFSDTEHLATTEAQLDRALSLVAAGADIIVLLAHTGIDAGPERPMMENAIVPLAALRDVDAIIAGHSHEVFPPEGSDPASLAWDAMEQAERDGTDLLMIDTAGRLQNRTELMDELDKIRRVLGRLNPAAPHNVVLVLDATSGQNALSQIEVFQDVAKVTGLIMTKLDGTARGGVLVAAAKQFGLPIHAIGIGETVEDLRPFKADDLAAAIAGIEK
jgi:hypothetical protein